MVFMYYFLLFVLCYSSELFEEYYQKAEEKMSKMTIEEKIGQIFFPRFNLATSRDDIKTKKPGGFMLFQNDFNFEEKYIQNYIKDIQKLSNDAIGLPLGLAVDEEGGRVNRVSRYHRDKPFPSPQQIYNESGIDGILKIDQEKRNLLRKFFLNINLAPVADLSYNSKDYIYERTIGRGPEDAVKYIEKDVEGYVNDNFSCTLKHFPGYGNNIVTHLGIAIDNRAYEIFQKEDLTVFQAGIKNKVPFVLVSHNIVTCKDNKYPASLSKTWHDILRNELKFSGLIMTDDISMGSIKKYTDNISPAVLAVQAGNDIILTSDYYIHYDDVLNAYKNGIITENMINSACKRIIAWKFKYLLQTNNPNEEKNAMIDKLIQSQKYASKKETLKIIGNLLLNNGYETSWVAGILANIFHEGSIGFFESSAYISHPEKEPQYLKYMDKLYNYKTKYSGKIITEVNMHELNFLLKRLRTDHWEKGKFGLGCIQWTGERTFRLFLKYKSECKGRERITLDEATAAEGKMIIEELSGTNKDIYDDWKKDNKDKNVPIAAYNAGHIICMRYEAPAEKEMKAKKRGKTATDMFSIMTK